MSRVAEWLKSAGLGQFAGNFSNTEEDQFLALQVPLLAAAQPSLLSPRSLARRARAATAQNCCAEYVRDPFPSYICDAYRSSSKCRARLLTKADISVSSTISEGERRE